MAEGIFANGLAATSSRIMPVGRGRVRMARFHGIFIALEGFRTLVKNVAWKFGKQAAEIALAGLSQQGR